MKSINTYTFAVSSILSLCVTKKHQTVTALSNKEKNVSGVRKKQMRSSKGSKDSPLAVDNFEENILRGSSCFIGTIFHVT